MLIPTSLCWWKNKVPEDGSAPSPLTDDQFRKDKLFLPVVLGGGTAHWICKKKKNGQREHSSLPRLCPPAPATATTPVGKRKWTGNEPYTRKEGAFQSRAAVSNPSPPPLPLRETFILKTYFVIILKISIHPLINTILSRNIPVYFSFSSMKGRVKE